MHDKLRMYTPHSVPLPPCLSSLPPFFRSIRIKTHNDYLLLPRKMAALATITKNVLSPIGADSTHRNATNSAQPK